jgi:uncharacterized protein YqgV (UPF0045/DUF77 family)
MMPERPAVLEGGPAVRSPLLLVAVAVVLVGALLLVRAPSAAQEAPQQTQLVAALDVTPIRQELLALRAELAAIRTAVADEKGLRADLTKAVTAVEAVAKDVADLAKTMQQYAKTTEPVIQALKPPKRWEYRILRTTSEQICNRLGQEGWEMACGYENWIYFRRPLAEGAAPKPKEE